jgi:RNA polymerase sigma-B factor
MSSITATCPPPPCWPKIEADVRPAEKIPGYPGWPATGTLLVHADQPRQLPPGLAVRELTGLEDRELLGIVRSLPRGSDRRSAACDVLVSRYRDLVRSCVRRYRYSPELTEDLMQVGYVGLVNAINNFNPDVGGSLAAYAQPCISGEIKRHFRDKRWPIHVQRPVQDLVLAIRGANEKLTQDLGRVPTDSDLARHLGVSGDAVRAARGAELAFQPGSLDAPVGESGTASLADFLGADDPRLDHMLGMQAIAAHWRELPPRERGILVMRFYDEMTQAQIGLHLGISQMQVSRLLAHALGYLRVRLLGEADQLRSTWLPA